MSARTGPKANTRSFSHPRSVVAAVIVCAATAVAVYLGAIAMSGRLLAESTTAVPADMIVVLGGDGPPRAARAAELWRAGLAPRIVVAGDGDCTFIRQAMVEAGVDPPAIAIECRSRSTWENALNTSPFLEAADVQSAILVTSWFHSRRAVATFRAICPGVEWISVPARQPPVLLSAFGGNGVMVAAEYVKTVVYRLRAVLLLPRETAPGQLCVDETNAWPPAENYSSASW